MRMTSVMTTPAERKCIRGSGMSASSEKSQELSHILLPAREIHTEIIITIIMFLINMKTFKVRPILINRPSIPHFTNFNTNGMNNKLES